MISKPLFNYKGYKNDQYYKHHYKYKHSQDTCTQDNERTGNNNINGLSQGSNKNLYFQSLGNHEFDNGEESIVEFARRVDFPVVASNLNKTLVPEAGNETTGHAVLTVQGRRIGFVGYVTRETPIISFPGTDCIYIQSDLMFFCCIYVTEKHEIRICV